MFHSEHSREREVTSMNSRSMRGTVLTIDKVIVSKALADFHWVRDKI